MENSPLELYEKAYRLHYLENKLPEACKVYETIIREFPESNECGYSVIQLQKIQSNLVSETSSKIKKGLHPLVVVTLVLNLLIAVALVALAGFYLNTKDRHLHYVSSLSRAIVKAQIGQDQEALNLLAELKMNTQGDLTPYLLAADIYRANHRYDLAVEELDTVRKLFPNAQVLNDEIERIRKEEARKQKMAVQSSRFAGPPETVPVKKPKPKRSKRPAVKRRSSQARTTKKAEKKAPDLIVDEDSISFF
ncbi:MAG: hypothetical protein GF401_20775 [Chitinivibrionales bacterium]|nr:hypothetical protein [Chitinivibrionales bacterium]